MPPAVPPTGPPPDLPRRATAPAPAVPPQPGPRTGSSDATREQMHAPAADRSCRCSGEASRECNSGTGRDLPPRAVSAPRGLRRGRVAQSAAPRPDKRGLRAPSMDSRPARLRPQSLFRRRAPARPKADGDARLVGQGAPPVLRRRRRLREQRALLPLERPFSAKRGEPSEPEVSRQGTQVYRRTQALIISLTPG